MTTSTTEVELGLVPRGRTTYQQIDYSALDKDTIYQALVDHILAVFPQQKDSIASTGFSIVATEIAYIVDLLSYRADYLANNNFITTATNLRALDNLLSLIGYKRSSATPAVTDIVIVPQNTVGDVTVPAESALNVHIPALTTVTGIGTDGTPVSFELFASASNIYDDIVIPTGAANVTAYAVEGVSKTFQAVADGSRNFTVTLPDFMVINSTIRVNVGIWDTTDPNRGTPYQPNLPEWMTVNFLVTNGQENIYTIKLRSDGYTDIIFGDGTFGNLVPNGQTIIVNYRTGGTASGNVPAQNLNGNGNFPIYAGGIKTPTTMKCGMTNTSRGLGGNDEEGIQQAKFLAPLVYQAQGRMVKDIDYAAIALKNPSVAQVVAVSRQDIVIDSFMDSPVYNFPLQGAGAYSLAFDLHNLDTRTTKSYQASFTMPAASYTNINQLVIDLNTQLGWVYNQTSLAFQPVQLGSQFIAHFDISIEGFIELWISPGDYQFRVTLKPSGNSVLPILNMPYGGYGRVDANYVDMHILAYAADGSVSVPNNALVNELNTYFEQFAEINTEIVIRRGFLQLVDITGDVFIDPTADPVAVNAAVNAAILGIFNSSSRQLGEPLYVSQVYQVITAVEGVAYVDNFSPSQNVTPDARTLLQAGNITITFYTAK